MCRAREFLGGEFSGLWRGGSGGKEQEFFLGWLTSCRFVHTQHYIYRALASIISSFCLHCLQHHHSQSIQHFKQSQADSPSYYICTQTQRLALNHTTAAAVIKSSNKATTSSLLLATFGSTRAFLTPPPLFIRAALLGLSISPDHATVTA